MAQLVEHNLAKVGVAGSSPVVRSIAFPDRLGGPFSAKWPSGKAEACKAFTPGSNPGFASRQHPGAPAPVLFYICGHGSVGRAQPCQGWGRGFEPRCPLQTQQPDYYGSRAFSYPSLGLEPERERALSKRGAFVASWRGRRQAAEAGAYLRSKYADSPRKASTLCRCDADRTAACHAPHQRRPRRKIHPRIPTQTGMRFPDDVSSGKRIPESSFGMGCNFQMNG